MNTFLGILFVYFAWSHMQDAFEPNRMSRTQVRIQSGMLCLFSATIAIIMLFGGSGA